MQHTHTLVSYNTVTSKEQLLSHITTCVAIVVCGTKICTTGEEQSTGLQVIYKGGAMIL